MAGTREPNDTAKRDISVRDEAAYALSKSGAERLEALLHAEKPMQVVRSLPDRDLYLTVRQVGPLDALPVLALASPGQIQHVLDLEAWRQDRFDGQRAGAWVAVLLESGEPSLRQFIRRADDELLVALFARWARVSQIEFDDQIPIHGSGESEAGDERGFVSPDGFHRFSPERQEHAPAVRRAAELLFREQPERYARILQDALWQLPAEQEERALHWRQSRLEEHGFPAPEEAREIYLPPRGARLEPGEPVLADGGGTDRPLPSLELREGWMRSLAADLPAEDYDRLTHQLGALANRVLVADHMDTGDPESHRAALGKAAVTVGLALQARHGAEGRTAAELVRELPLVELFREGYALVDALVRDCRELLDHGWPARVQDGLDLVDPPLRQRIAGLLESQPMYYQVPGGGVEETYREFRTLDEIAETRTALDLARRVGSVFVTTLGLDVPRLVEQATGLPFGPPRFSTLLMTMMAWHASRGELRLEPLPEDVLADFLRNVASLRTTDPEAPARALDRLVHHLAEHAGLDPGDASALERFGRACLPTLRAECGQLDPGSPPDQKSVSTLLIQRS